MATNTDPLDLKVEKIKDEIEMIFQTILTSFIERKDALLRRLEERVKLLGNEYTGLMDEYSELLRMRDQMEESLNKNQYFDLRTDMLSPLQTRIKQQEQKIHSEFKLEFTYHGFEHLLTTIENFGDVYFPGDAPRIPSPPPDIPYTDATPATQPTRHAMYHPPVINLSPLAALTIPRPPPNIPKNFLLGNYVQETTYSPPEVSRLLRQGEVDLLGIGLRVALLDPQSLLRPLISPGASCWAPTHLRVEMLTDLLTLDQPLLPLD